ncbi:hypothetical protein EO087_05040 [Dyella sp. M7H15-1]|uniref:hypothetical protein n=1 Tax=Dyella sp. M7H15-1 TaxID=2501295 RepID=UPI0010050FC3|nr:hypothetical protein [Dyella sp. M7H15-1]QAU23423.1 hypothetical protein EO087_05040 [Dyella sp. M7H15-1]
MKHSIKRLLAALTLATLMVLLSGCYIAPGYGYVQGNGVVGDTYYGTAPTVVYNYPYYGYGYGYYPYGYWGGYYGCCWGGGYYGRGRYWSGRGGWYGHGGGSRGHGRNSGHGSSGGGHWGGH